MDKKEALKQAKEFADDLDGIIGQLPMGRVVAKHVQFFLGLRNDGVTWPQIAEFMKGVGIRRKDGKPVPPEQWRAMVSRASNQSAKLEEKRRPLQSKKQNKIEEKNNDQLVSTNKSTNDSHTGLRSMMAKATRARK